MLRVWRANGLSITVLALFAVFLLIQVLAGHRVYLDQLATDGMAPVDLAGYLTSGHFVEATFENWESEFLQMGALVLLTVFLYQRGSPESKDPDADESVDREPDPARPGAPWPVRAGGVVRAVYERSLAIALFGLFLVSLWLHVVGGAGEYSRERLAAGEPAVTAFEFLATPGFWFQSMQNWQSEFLSVGVLVLLTVVLRQRGSPESKPVDEPLESTG
ncbi:MAG: hypothetical protein KF809_06765 [Chloroflexi bacterium]|nr:hypothetical protein [Chloroflexota bacterium]